MSHFSLCVAIPAEDCPEKVTSVHRMEMLLDPVLACYEESPSVRTRRAFEDCTDDARKMYETGTVDMVRLPDGTRCTFSDPRFYEDYILEDGVFYLRKTGQAGRHVETDETKSMLLLPDTPVREAFSFDEYCRDHLNYRRRKGRWGYFYNPDAKWDWWCVGGRFSGAFLVRSDQEEYIPAELGKSGSSGGYRSVNGARKKDICWDEMKRRATARKKRTYAEAKKAFETKCCDALGPFVSISENEVNDWGTCLYKNGETLEQFLLRKALGPDDRYPLSPYAFLDIDDQWHSSGEMGWFGVSANDMPEEDWLHTVQSFIEELSDDDYLVTVDCHI